MHLNKKKQIPGVRRNHELCINNFQPNKHFHHRLARSVAMKIQVGLNPYTVHREASVELERHHDIRLKSEKREREIKANKH